MTDQEPRDLDLWVQETFRGILPVLGSPVLVFMILGFCLSGGIEEFIDFFTFSDPDSPRYRNIP